MVFKNSEKIEKAVKTYGGQIFYSHSHCTNTVIIHMERYLAQYICDINIGKILGKY
ncbi:hypothetical protein E2C01_077720 [Portunus trituberculatus]|uniref:Uncharacterized protein n=1 Tax=Portunus trituberculatus TaxID=210409 RepID=A0A5B7IC60_PORTR|nr:hypothetical protein [Portunus trituberculatus]